MQVRGKEGEKTPPLFFLSAYKSFWFPNLGQLEHIYLALLMVKSHFSILRTLHLATVLLGRRAPFWKYIKLSDLQRANRKKIHGRLEEKWSYSIAGGWCVAVLSIWRGCSSGSILLQEVEMGRKSKVINKMGLVLKKQPWEEIVFNPASFQFLSCASDKQNSPNHGVDHPLGISSGMGRIVLDLSTAAQGKIWPVTSHFSSTTSCLCT